MEVLGNLESLGALKSIGDFYYTTADFEAIQLQFQLDAIKSIRERVDFPIIQNIVANGIKSVEDVVTHVDDVNIETDLNVIDEVSAIDIPNYLLSCNVTMGTLPPCVGETIEEAVVNMSHSLHGTESDTMQMQGILSYFSGGVAQYIGNKFAAVVGDRLVQKSVTLSKLISKLDTILDKIINSFDWLSGVVSDLASFLVNIKNRCYSYFSQIVESVQAVTEHFAYIMPLVAGVFFTSCIFFSVNKFLSIVAPDWVMNSMRLLEMISVITCFVGIKEFGGYILSSSKEDKLKFIHYIKSFFGMDSEDETSSVDIRENGTEYAQMLQGGFYDVGIFGVMISLFTFFCPVEIKQDIWSMSSTASVMKNFVDSFDRFKKVSDSLVDKIFSYLGNGTLEYSGAGQALLLHTGISIGSWLDDTEKLLIEGNTSVEPMETVLSRTRALIDKADKITAFLSSSEEGTTFVLRNKFCQVEKRLKEFYGKLVQGALCNKYRACPFVTCFLGKPGVGKSSLVRQFADIFLDAMEEPKTDRVYGRSGGDAYWSNYCRQPMVIFDDFAQTKQENNRYDEETLIQLVSCNPYMVPMAALEEKGRPFDSKYITLCTNAPYVHGKADLADKHAYYRRRHVLWEVTRNENVPFNPNCTWENLLFSRKNTFEPEAYHEDEIIGVGFKEMVAYTATLAAKHNDEQQRMIAINESSVSHFSLKKMPDGTFQAVEDVNLQGMTPPNTRYNLDHLIDTYGEEKLPYLSRFINCDDELVFDRLGEKDLFHTNGTRIIWNNLSDEEKIIILKQNFDGGVGLFDNEIHGDMTLSEIQFLLMASFSTDNTDYLTFRHFITSIHLDEFIKTEGRIITPKNKSISPVDFRIFFNAMSDRSQYLCIQYAKALDKKNVSLISEIRDFIKGVSVKELWDKVPLWVKWVVSIGSLFLGSMILYKGLSTLVSLVLKPSAEYILLWASGAKFMDFVQGPSSGGDSRVLKSARRSVRNWRIQGAGSIGEPHLNSFDKAMRARIKIVGRRVGSAIEMASSNGICIGPRKYLMPTHLIQKLNFAHSMTLETGEDVIAACFIKPSGVKYDMVGKLYGNLAVVYASNTTPPCTYYDKITLDFSKKAGANTPGIVLPNIGDSFVGAKTLFQKTSLSIDYLVDDLGMKWPSGNSFQAMVPNAPGVCGRVAMHEVPGCWSICGMHFAGDPIRETSTYSEISTRLISESQEMQGGGSNTCPLKEPVKVTNMVTEIEELEVTVPVLRKTQIEKSMIHDPLIKHFRAPTTEQTILSPLDTRPKIPYDPYAQGLLKFDTQSGPFDFSTKDSPENLSLDYIRMTWDQKKPKNFPIDTVCSLEVAINGVDGLPYAENLPVSTSEGFPYILDRNGTPGKSRYFEETTAGRIPKGDWVEDVKDIISAAKSQELEIYSIACAKDEKTKLAKIYDDPKTRIFEILPFTFNIAIRKYFFFIMQWLMANHNVLPCKVGIDPFGFDWDTMALKHLAYGNHFCGDYSGFDSNTNVDVMLKICDMISEFANDGIENLLIRRGLMKAALTRKMIVGKRVYRIVGGTPSGFALTVMINSLVNEFLLRMSWFQISRELSIPADHSDLTHHVTMSTYGDDNVVSFSHDVSHWYNLVTIAGCLRKRNIILSDGKKTGILTPRMDFKDIDFLKRKWTLSDYGWYKSPLDKASIEEQLYYVKKSEDPLKTTQVNIDNALREAYFHGQEYFDSLRKIILDACFDTGYSFEVKTYIAAEQQWYHHRKYGEVPVHYANPEKKFQFFFTKKIHECDGIKFGLANHFRDDPDYRKGKAIFITNERGLRDTDRMTIIYLSDSPTIQNKKFKQAISDGAKYVTAASDHGICSVFFCLYLYQKEINYIDLYTYISSLDDQSYRKFTLYAGAPDF